MAGLVAPRFVPTVQMHHTCTSRRNFCVRQKGRNGHRSVNGTDYRGSSAQVSRRSSSRPRATQAETLSPPAPAIHLTDGALTHLRNLRNARGSSRLLLRVGVKSGGCSGMSYLMDFESPDNVTADDAVMEYADGFQLVCDPKSLLYLFGMELDYSDALIGGGFQFHNPNAASSCGCGKSFGV